MATFAEELDEDLIREARANSQHLLKTPMAHAFKNYGADRAKQAKDAALQAQLADALETGVKLDEARLVDDQRRLVGRRRGGRGGGGGRAAGRGFEDGRERGSRAHGPPRGRRRAAARRRLGRRRRRAAVGFGRAVGRIVGVRVVGVEDDVRDEPVARGGRRVADAAGGAEPVAPAARQCGSLCCSYWHAFWRAHAATNCSSPGVRPLKRHYCGATMRGRKERGG